MVKNLYILSRLSYGLESFGPFLSEGQIDLVDLNLKKIARRITGCSIYTRSLPLLLEANMLPMKLIIEKQARTALFRYRSLKWLRSTNRIAKGFWSSKLPQEDCTSPSKELFNLTASNPGRMYQIEMRYPVDMVIPRPVMQMWIGTNLRNTAGT